MACATARLLLTSVLLLLTDRSILACYIHIDYHVRAAHQRSLTQSASEITGQLRTMAPSQLRSLPVQFALRTWEAIRAADYYSYFSAKHWERSSELQRCFLEFGARHILRPASLRRMTKAYNLLPSDFMASSLRYDDDVDGDGGDAGDGAAGLSGGRVALAAVLSDVCPAADVNMGVIQTGFAAAGALPAVIKVSH